MVAAGNTKTSANAHGARPRTAGGVFDGEPRSILMDRGRDSRGGRFDSEDDRGIVRQLRNWTMFTWPRKRGHGTRSIPVFPFSIHMATQAWPRHPYPICRPYLPLLTWPRKRGHGTLRPHSCLLLLHELEEQ